MNLSLGLGLSSLKSLLGGAGGAWTVYKARVVADGGTVYDADRAETVYSEVTAVDTPTLLCTCDAGKAEVLYNIIPDPTALTGYLDDYGLPTAAYSVDKVVSTYTDAVVRVRRASDNEEADVAFDNDTITLDSAVDNFSTGSLSATLGEFVANASYSDPDSLGSPDDAFVATWYDQAGNNDATQITGNDQPQIVNAGALVTENGKVALDFDGVDDYLFNTSLTIAGGEDSPMSSLVVGASNDVTATQRLYGFGRSVSVNPFTDLLFNASNIHYRKRSDIGTFKSTNGSTTLVNNTQYLFSTFTAGTAIDLYLNSASEISSGDIDVPILNIDQFGIGALLFGSSVVSYMNGTIQEIIFYDSDKSALRTAIEGNINGRFNIYT